MVGTIQAGMPSRLLSATGPIMRGKYRVQRPEDYGLNQSSLSTPGHVPVSYDPTLTPLNDIPENERPRNAPMGFSIGPLGTQHFHGWGGDSVRISLFLKPSAFSSLTNRFCVVISLDARTERVRHKDVAIIRKLTPRLKPVSSEVAGP